MQPEPWLRALITTTNNNDDDDETLAIPGLHSP
jgi:hypothetical protein